MNGQQFLCPTPHFPFSLKTFLNSLAPKLPRNHCCYKLQCISFNKIQWYVLGPFHVVLPCLFCFLSYSPPRPRCLVSLCKSPSDLNVRMPSLSSLDNFIFFSLDNFINLMLYMPSICRIAPRYLSLSQMSLLTSTNTSNWLLNSLAMKS